MSYSIPLLKSFQGPELFCCLATGAHGKHGAHRTEHVPFPPVAMSVVGRAPQGQSWPFGTILGCCMVWPEQLLLPNWACLWARTHPQAASLSPQTCPALVPLAGPDPNPHLWAHVTRLARSNLTTLLGPCCSLEHYVLKTFCCFPR